MESRLEDALRAWVEKLGADAVLTSDTDLAAYRNNVSALDPSIPAVLLPATTEQVREIVLIANTYRQPLYPISRGKNWGLGSRVPSADGCVIVDLQRMNRILKIDAELGYAVIEPGVTQRQLHDEITKLGLPVVINVIGSGLDTSLIGNALERGIGYFASRADAMSGLEVVLGSGEIIKTGFGHYEGAKCRYTYRHGVGPGLQDLFHQSNFGIVTSASIELLPWEDEHVTLVAKIRDAARLRPMVDALLDLRRRELIRMVVHIGNRERTFSTLAPLLCEQLAREDGGLDAEACRRRAVDLLEREGFGPWSAVASLSGPPEVLKAVVAECRRALSGIADVSLMNQRKIAAAQKMFLALAWMPAMKRKAMLLNAMLPVINLANGCPTDEALKSVYWAAGRPVPGEGESLDPDQAGCGFLFSLPIFTGSGGASEAMVRTIDDVCGEFGFPPAVTLNIVDAHNMEAVISFGFDATDAAAGEKARACNRALLKKFVEMGYPPYRVGVQEMDVVVDPSDPFWETVARVKMALDPNGIISPGRYGP